MLFKLMKLWIMMVLVVWVAAAVSAMVSGGMMRMKGKMPGMKEKYQNKWSHMMEKPCEEMEEAKEAVE
ncbi:MAG: hypothetical protein ISF22_01840 [Methanomassiliicoccus sp.]|nr:hypothetical protein [Methanomassiliicoccus sp.]